ncbi:MAG: tRNA 2-thiouridine(34) synthase MnmA [Anaerolineae bacterium]
MRERVVVAMSGGVDSSMAAALLVEQGYEVIGVMLRLWSEDLSPQPISLAGKEVAESLLLEEARAGLRPNRCCSLESIRDARAVADRLAIPFYVINAEQPFKENVVDFFVREYVAGRTPNPCLACNRRIRFGFLLAYARSLGASYLATGHYARIRRGPDGRYQLWRGADRSKDQSYVLSVLGQAELAQALFPVGEYTKLEVRALAAARGLPTASRVESQDLCFIADGDYRRFLTEHAGQAIRPGPILDRQGRQLGTHRGLPFYTIGQRGGLGIAAAQPLYVLALDVARNAVIVGTAAELGQRWLRAEQVNWIAGQPPSSPLRAAVQIRYRAEAVPATILPRPDAVEVHLSEPLRAITPGQAAVFYDGEICLGGGIIVETRADAEGI